MTDDEGGKWSRKERLRIMAETRRKVEVEVALADGDGDEVRRAGASGGVLGV